MWNERSIKLAGNSMTRCELHVDPVTNAGVAHLWGRVGYASLRARGEELFGGERDM